MTRPQRRPASLRVFPELGLVMRWPGFFACLTGFHEVERSRALGRFRVACRDSAAASLRIGGAVGVARGRGTDC